MAGRVFLKALSLATRAEDYGWICEVLIPELVDRDWSAHRGTDEWLLAIRSCQDWGAAPALASQQGAVFRSPDPAWHLAENSMGTGPFDEKWGRVMQTRSAHVLADFLSGQQASGLSISQTHAQAALWAGLPVDPRAHTPRAFLETVKKARSSGPAFRDYLSSGALVRALASKGRSLAPMASAVRAWALFCDACGIPHFPVFSDWVAKFASTCRDYGTYRSYVSYLSSACEFISLPSEWASSHQVKRAKEGLRRQALVHKGPALAVDAATLLSIASVPDWCEKRFFVVLSWVFMLRAGAEASGLRLVSNSVAMKSHEPLPMGFDAVVGLGDNALTIGLGLVKMPCSVRPF